MNSPTSYAEWCTLMDTITKDFRDESYIDLIRGGSISWTSGVAERFIVIVTDMIRNRVNAAQDKYQVQIKNARDNIGAVISALQTLKKEYSYDYAMVNALPIPEQYRKQLLKMIQDHADQTQQSLETSAKADRTGHLSVLVRNAHINQLT